MARNLKTETVTRFKGINLWTSHANLGPEWAQDCLNVIPNSSGGISKLRSPVSLSAAVANLDGAGNIVNFQNSLGTRQVIAMVGEYVYRFSLDAYNSTYIDQDALNDAVASFVQSNNILFVANGLRMMKWTGTAWRKWGIEQAAGPGVTMQSSTGILDPIDAPTGYFADWGWSYAIRTYGFVFTWVDASGNETLPSPIGFATAGGVGYLCRVNYAGTPPSNAVGWNLYVDVENAGAGPFYRVNQSEPDGIPMPLFFDDIYHTPYFLWENYPVWHNPGELIEPPVANGTGTGRTLLTGRYYKIAYGNADGHIGAASPASAFTGVVNPPQDIFVVAQNPSDDDQIDRIFLYSTEDGGADYYLSPNKATEDGSFPLDSGDSTTIPDGVDDADLDKSTIAPTLNFPPPVGNYIQKWKGRIFVAVGQDIYYSGYERINVGRPEESFPLRNRLRLAIGADDIQGMGAIPAGIVAFSKSNEMFVFTGTVEDITVDAPVEYSAFLEQLPYEEGCSAPLSVQASSRGLIWLGSDKNLKIWNGQGEPVPLAPMLYPLFRRITSGQEINCRGTLFKWIDKHWYTLLMAIDDSTSLNKLAVIDLEPNLDLNVGAFVLDVGVMDAIDVVEDSNGKRQLVFLSGGSLWRLPTDSVTTGGLSS